MPATMTARGTALVLAAALTACACSHPPIRFPAGRPTAECPRGTPRPLLVRKNPFVLSTLFVRKSAALAVETARLKGNHRLRIIHTGCTRYALSFRFDLQGRSRGADDARYWYERTSRIVGKLAFRSPDGEGLRRISKQLAKAGAVGVPYGRAMDAGPWQTMSLNVRQPHGGKGTVVTLDYKFSR